MMNHVPSSYSERRECSFIELSEPAVATYHAEFRLFHRRVVLREGKKAHARALTHDGVGDIAENVQADEESREDVSELQRGEHGIVSKSKWKGSLWLDDVDGFEILTRRE